MTDALAPGAVGPWRGVPLAVLGILTFLGCSASPHASTWVPEDFPNTLDLRGAPDSARDLTVFAFSDLGSWAMYGLPSPGDGDEAGTFPGPFLLPEGGLWLSPSLVGMEVVVEGEPLDLLWAPNNGAAPVSLPGFLRQDLVGGRLAIRLELGFVSPDAALVTATIRNGETRLVEVVPRWVGGTFFIPTRVQGGRNGVVLTVEGSGTRVSLEPQDGRMLNGEGPGPEVSPSGYRIPLVPLALEPNEEHSFSLLVRVRVGPGIVGVGEGMLTEDPAPFEKAGHPRAMREGVEKRWTELLNRILGSRWEDGTAVDPGAARRVAVKSIQTLLSNWRSPLGGLRHDGLFPSYAYRGFHGVWAWDSWKQARALALFAPELAENQIRVMLDHQGRDGMIPDVIYVDSTENNWRDTKPPLAAWAVAGIFESTADTSFVAEVLPALVRYHEWWYRHRDHDGNGLCEYGSTDGTRIAAAWESGMDNAVRFDEAVMVQNGPGAWSLNQESVDLNAYLFAEKGYLAGLSDVVGQQKRAGALREEARALEGRIRDTFYDPETGYFYDVKLDTKAPIRVQGPEGWIPLWAGIATPEQAATVTRVMMDPTKFAGWVPLPTLAMDHPAFDPSDGYWRGPVWLDQAYFGIHGLARYGFRDEARELAGRILENAQGLRRNGPIFENYHPVTGEGLNAPHFSWSAAHLLMLFHEGFFDGTLPREGSAP